MTKTVIIVEGCSDAVFLNDLIYTLLPEGSEEFKDLKKFTKGKSVKICNNPEILIFIAGGCTHIKKFKQKIQEYVDFGYSILVIQDADNPIKDPFIGGVAKRKSYLEEFSKETSINFESFLFPNNADDGDLETVLLTIVNTKKYEPFFNSYSAYSDAVKSFSIELHATELLEFKYLVFNYCQVYNGAEKSNEKKRFYRTEYWDLEHESIKPLKDFLIRHIGL